MSKNFEKIISIYEMAKMDALRASIMKVRELLDNEPSKEINLDNVSEFKSVKMNENGSIVFVNQNDLQVNIENIDANSLIDIVSKIVIEKNY